MIRTDDKFSSCLVKLDAMNKNGRRGLFPPGMSNVHIRQRRTVTLTTYFTSKERALLPTVWFKDFPAYSGEGSVADITDITPPVEL
jgi:hypothetical protein